VATPLMVPPVSRRVSVIQRLDAVPLPTGGL
jgi:hypothetical protein